jgi:hypothetical protein
MSLHAEKSGLLSTVTNIDDEIPEFLDMAWTSAEAWLHLSM